MKVILSRKGFDSSFGGYPSFIMPDGVLLSLPIPNYKDNIKYSQIYTEIQENTLYDLMILKSNVIKSSKWYSFTKETKCHFDPDLNYNALPRKKGWVGTLGQTGIAQKLLMKHNIKRNDLFLFFGWFDNYENIKKNSTKGKHVIFGYLQIDKILYTKSDKIPDWLENHPHVLERRLNNEYNCIYIAREQCSWNNNIKGYGTFLYDEELVLTATNMSRSKWHLPDIFKNVNITYHNKNSWKLNYFQSAMRGQEFIIEENISIEKWAKQLIENNVKKRELLNKKEIL